MRDTHTRSKKRAGSEKKTVIPLTGHSDSTVPGFLRKYLALQKAGISSVPGLFRRKLPSRGSRRIFPRYNDKRTRREQTEKTESQSDRHNENFGKNEK